MPTAVAMAGAIGAALFTAVHDNPRAREVADVALAEPGASPVCEPGDFLLGVGCTAPGAAQTLLHECADAGASGLVLRLPLAADPQLLRAARGLAVPLVGLRPGFPWAHVVWLLRTVLDRSATAEAGTGGVHTDLFALADALAGIVEAPVTIEDSQSRVLAYSSEQGAVDPTRVSTIVGRRVPADVVAHMRSQGVFRRLAVADEPFLTPPGPDGTRPRLVIPVRAGREWLGAVWALRSTAVHGPALRRVHDAASVVALHLLRLRAQAEVVSRESSEQLRALLRDGPPGAPLPGPSPARAVALHSGGDTDVAVDLWRATLRRHGWAQPALTVLQGTCFAVVAADGDGAGSWPWLARVVYELNSSDPTARAAAGAPAANAAQLVTSRRIAAELLAAICDHEGDPARSVEDSWALLTLARAGAALRAGELLGPLAAVLAHDREHGTDHAATLTAWLRHPGRPLAAARELHVHVNTLRYRMGRISRLAPLDLDDPTARLALHLLLAAHRS